MADFLETMIPIKWNESTRIFTSVTQKINDFWKTAPCPIESTEVNIQPTCGQCGCTSRQRRRESSGVEDGNASQRHNQDVF